MAVGYNPTAVTNGLVLSLDAANEKCFPTTTPIQEHGYADWYCFLTVSVTYSIVSSGVAILERQSNGTITTVVATSTGPARGTFTATAGRFYYGSGGPINLVAEDQHHAIVPLTMAGTQFVWFVFRNTPGTCYIYSPFKTATIKFWDNPATGGITNSTPTQTLTVNAGTQTSFTFTTPVNGEVTETFYLTSTEPIIASTTQTDADRTILSPASKYVYQRFATYNSTVNQLTPTVSNNGCVHDPVNAVMSQSIADGGGIDTAQGLGLEFLSDRYSWGNVLSDYCITFPYTATVVTSYWNGSAWIVWDTHTATGNLTNPITAARDGTNGPGVDAGNLSGLADNMASGATLWKWEGTAPFYICINDSVDDEFSVLGWMNTRISARNKNQYWVDSVSGNQLAVHGSLIHNSAGYWTFPNDQITNYLMLPNYANPTGDITYSCWFRSKFTGPVQTPFTYSVNGNNEMLFFISNSTTLTPHPKNIPVSVTTTDMANKWVNFTWTRVASTGFNIFYRDGVQIGTYTETTGSNITTGGFIIIGQESDLAGGGSDPGQNLDGDFAMMMIYNRVLTAAEVERNFNAFRGRFGV